MRKKAKSLQLVPHVEGPSACTRFPTKLHRPLPLPEGQLHLQVYTDDTLLFGRTQQALTKVITNLQTDPTLNDKGEVHDFLGIRIDRSQHKTTIILTQPGLIDQILADRNLTGTKEEVTPNFTPAAGVLHPDKGGANRERAWKYQHPA